MINVRGKKLSARDRVRNKIETRITIYLGGCIALDVVGSIIYRNFDLFISDLIVIVCFISGLFCWFSSVKFKLIDGRLKGDGSVGSFLEVMDNLYCYIGIAVISLYNMVLVFKIIVLWGVK